MSEWTVLHRQLDPDALVVYVGKGRGEFTYAAAVYRIIEQREVEGVVEIRERVEHGRAMYANEAPELYRWFEVAGIAMGELRLAAAEKDRAAEVSR